MRVRIYFNVKKGKYVIQKKQYWWWSTTKYMTARKNPKWWQTVDYLEPCIFNTKDEAEKFLNQYRVMINNYGQKTSIEVEGEVNNYEKYNNRDPRCHYPFEPEPMGYCWGYAGWVDNGENDYEQYVKKHCEKCDKWEVENETN